MSGCARRNTSFGIRSLGVTVDFLQRTASPVTKLIGAMRFLDTSVALYTIGSVTGEGEKARIAQEL